MNILKLILSEVIVLLRMGLLGLSLTFEFFADVLDKLSSWMASARQRMLGKGE